MLNELSRNKIEKHDWMNKHSRERVILARYALPYLIIKRYRSDGVAASYETRLGKGPHPRLKTKNNLMQSWYKKK